MIGKRIKTLRKKADISQSELASNLGVSNALISSYESGSKKPGIETLEKLADFFNCTVDYLLGRTNHPLNQILNENEFPEEIKGIGIESIEIIKGANLSPEELRILIESAKGLQLLKLLRKEAVTNEIDRSN